MTQTINSKHYDLEERTFLFARNCRDLVKVAQYSLANKEYSKQLIRSSGSVAANYIEANQALSKKDFYLRIKVCRKEARESHLWLRLMEMGDNTALADAQTKFIQEAFELTKIFGSILDKGGQL